MGGRGSRGAVSEGAFPKVSVIVPTYNRERFVLEAVRSALGQTFSDLEVIVLDDGSTDRTAEGIREITDARVRYFLQENTGRPGVVRNRAIAQARGEYVAFLDSDDAWLPGKLARQLAEAEAHPEAGLIYSFTREVDRAGRPGAVFGPNFDGSGSQFEQLLFLNFIPIQTVLVPRRVLEDVGTFDESPEFRAIEDYELWLRIAARYPIRLVPEVLAFYRVHEGGISADRITQLNRLEALLERIFARHSVGEELQRRVRAHLAYRKFNQHLVAGQVDSGAVGFLKQTLSANPGHRGARVWLWVERLGWMGFFVALYQRRGWITGLAKAWVWGRRSFRRRLRLPRL
jgi:glycosyltransferase involved in cell wall biosynthesis